MNKKQILGKWKLFIDSFKLKKNFLYIFFYDLLFYLIMVPLFALFAFILNKKTTSIDLDALSRLNTLTNLTASQAQEVELAAKSMQGFFNFFIFGIIFLAVISLLTFTLSRALIWNKLLNKKFSLKKYLKFNILNIILAAILIIFIFILLKIRMPLIMILVNISLKLALFISSLSFLIITILVTYFASLVYINYTETSKIFKSISKTFKMIKSKYSGILWSLLFILIVSIITSLVGRLIWLLPLFLQKYFNLALVLLFLAWMRIYIVKVIKEK